MKYYCKICDETTEFKSKNKRFRTFRHLEFEK